MLLALSIGLTLQAQVNWMTVDEAEAAMQKEPRKVLMDVYADWCGPCKMMDKNTYGNAEVADYINKNYYAIKFNAEGNETFSYKGKKYSNPGYKKTSGMGVQHQFAEYLSVTAYPTTVFFDEQLNPITAMRGYYDAKQFEPYLKLFATDAYKKIKTQEDFDAYQRSLKGND